jgi:hypothetical protein
MEEPNGTEEHLEKITIELHDDQFGTESLWAEPLGEGFYRLRNVPILAFGYSEQDVVSTDEVDGRRVVTGVSQPGGHSTYRLFLPGALDDARFGKLFEPLSQLGCTYERANARVFGVDVPPGADVYAAYTLLEPGEEAKQWSFEEGHCGHPLRPQAGDL